MRTSRRRRFTSIVVGATAALALTGLAVLAAPAGAQSAPRLSVAPARANYLILGDSIAFGYRPAFAANGGADYLDARNFKGYGEFLAPWFGLRTANAACPGETTSSFIDPRAQSNGCENSVGSDFGYRDAFPLHVNYARSQLNYAVKFLVTHPDTKLVTINIGANDLFVCQQTTADHCTGQDFADTLATIGQNLDTILTALRQQAGYHKRIVLLDYYSTDYNDPVPTIGAQFLNNTLNQVAAQHNVLIGDGFAAFKKASANDGGDPCAAGLLIKRADDTCDAHPTPYGHIVLAQAIAKAAAAPGPLAIRRVA